MTPRSSRAAKGARWSRPVPAAPPARSAAAHKIVDLRTTVVGTPWRELVFVELTTDSGLVGVGEVRIVNKTDTLVAAIHEASTRIARHPALQYLLTYEPEVVLPRISFHEMGNGCHMYLDWENTRATVELTEKK